MVLLVQGLEEVIRLEGHRPELDEHQTLPLELVRGPEPVAEVLRKVPPLRENNDPRRSPGSHPDGWESPRGGVRGCKTGREVTREGLFGRPSSTGMLPQGGPPSCLGR